MKTQNLFLAICLLALLGSFMPTGNASALVSTDVPPVDMFQLPWDQGLSWVAIDGLDNGTKRPLSSSHHFSVGGAIDFAPHNNMVKGEDTSNFWTTAAAAGTVVGTSSCYIIIDHGNGWITQYQFLADIQVRLGDSVSRNQRLGIIADGVRQKFCPGSAEPNVPHLHFMLRPTMRNATFAGWEVNYLPVLNKTTFTKNGQTLGLFKPLLNASIVPSTATPTVTETAPSVSETATLVPTSTPLGFPFTPTPTLFGPYVSTTVNPQTINLGETTEVTVTLNNVPGVGYTSAEFTCFYDQSMAEVSNIAVANLFGADAAMAINRPQNNRFIVAIAGSNDNKATTSGSVFTFSVKGLLIGQAQIGCEARVSQGNNALIQIPSARTHLDIVGNATTTPTFNPTPSTPTVLPSACDRVEFIADVNVPPGTVMSPGTTFIKTWRLKNIGPCAWNTSYQLVFFYGELMGGVTAVALPANVSVGQTVDISVNLTAPNAPGSYRGYWIFRNSNGIDFGIGPDANQPWFVDLNVSGPTLPPSPTFTRPPASATPTIPTTACDKAQMIADINIPDGTVMAPGTNFTKTWRLKNIGTCTWTTSYQLVFFSGEQMGSASSANFTQNVLVGQTVDVSINLTAPNAPGSYRGYWMFKNASGALFGIGPQANRPWWVDIRVSGSTDTPGPIVTQPFDSPTPSATPSGPTNTPVPSVTSGGPTATPISGVAFDFAANACAATWTSGAGQLPCPGIDGDAKGFVLKLSNPHLETGGTDTRSGLLTFPQNVQNGYIQGFYPPFNVQNGDRFRSIINCEGGATSCYVAFRLDYQTGNDAVKTFWGPFLERYDGHYYSVDVDLSSLAGKDVKFILTVLAAGSATGDRALWVGPIIYRVNLIPTPTATPAGGWLTYTNLKFGFEFNYPPQGFIASGSTDTNVRINDLPIVQPGTNLAEKYLEVVVGENATECRSPLPSQDPGETITLNGISFLKQMGEDGAAGSVFQWVAYSTLREGVCVSLGFILHSHNPGVFSTPPPLYNPEIESAVFGQIASTYTWLAISTATPTGSAEPAESETPTVTPTPGSFPTPAVSPTMASTPGLSPTPSGNNGAVAGQILVSKPVTVNVYDANAILVATMETDVDGRFRLEVSPGTYTVVVIRNGFLRAQGTAAFTAGNTIIMPPITLLAGDLDGNDVIDQFDALTIGMNYNASFPEAADLNSDGIINVLDLELLAKNYRKTGPVVWE